MYINNPSNLDAISALHAVPAIDATANLRLRDVVGNKEDYRNFDSTSTTKSVMAKIKGALSLLTAPLFNSTADVYARDTVGNKTDTERSAVATTYSLMAYCKGLVRDMTYRNVPKAVVAMSTSTTYASPVNYTGKGYLTGIFGVAYGTGQLQVNIIIDGVTFFTGNFLRGIAATGAGLGFNHRFDTSLQVQFRTATAAQEVSIGIAYTRAV